MDYKLLGMRIRQERSRKSLTQEQLSEMCNISSSYIGIIERGDKKLSVETLVKIASILEVSTDSLLKDTVKQLSESRVNDLMSIVNNLSQKEMEMVVDVISTMANHLKNN